MRRVRAGFGLLLLSLVLVCCRPQSRVGDRIARRVVSLSPSTTEALAAIGARETLVGRSRYCDFPPEISSVPVVGGFVDPNFEAIVALRPDLVIGARGPAGPQLADRLSSLGVATYFPETESLMGVEQMLRGLGTKTGHEGDAERVVLSIRARLDTVRASTAGLPRPRCILVFGLGPIVAAGPPSFANEMLALAGADNVVKEGGAYPTLGMERIMALAPDVVLDASMQEGPGTERISVEAPGWRELEAVKAGRVVQLRDEAILRPGPRIAQGVDSLARAVHPGVALP